jgi:anaerobic ribonucleoside-triphosphate reductase activating protein
MLSVDIAAVCVGTRALGPSVRSVVWVQGCPFRCGGCVAPDWIPFDGGRRTDVVDLVGELLSDPEVDGLTFSGGEPMEQAASLAEVARLARTVRPVSVVCFTGYRLSVLQRRADPGVARLLAEVDVLIDGRYVAALDDGRGLRGSSNQRVHHLTARHADCGYDFVGCHRDVEVRVEQDGVLLVGVPPPGLAEVVSAAARRGVARVIEKVDSHER